MANNALAQIDANELMINYCGTGFQPVKSLARLALSVVEWDGHATPSSKAIRAGHEEQRIADPD